MKQLDINDLLKTQKPSELNLDSLQYIIREINNPVDELKINAIKELLANFDIPKDISTKQLGILIQYWIDTDRSSFNEVSTGISLNSLDLEILIDNYEKRESEIKKTVANAGTAVNNARRRQEQLFEEAKKIKGQVEKAKEAERKINNQKIYANVEVPEIPKIDTAELKKTVEILENSEEELKNDLIQNGFAKDDQEASILAKAYVADISKKAAQPEISYFAPIQTAVLHKISTDKSFVSKVLQQDDLVIEAKKGSTLIAINARAEDYLFKKITESILNNKYSTYLYGPDSINVNLTTEKTADSNIEIDLKAIISNSIILQEKRYLEIERIDTNQEPRALLTTITSRYVESKSDKQTKPKVKVRYLEEFRKRIGLHKDKQEIFGRPVFNSEWVNIVFETDSSLKVFVEPAKQITSTNNGIVQILEIKNLISNNSATTSGTNEISKAAVKTGIKESITALFASIGMALGPLGAILIGALSWIGAEVVSKLAQWIKKNPEVAGLILGGLSFFGILPLFGPLIAFGVASIIVAGTVGVGITTAAVFGTLNLVRFVWSRIVISLAGPMFVLFVVVPILTVFILLIINNSAYVVPPSSYLSSIGADNPYMLVTKTANPSKSSNPTTNSTTIAYTVTIKALKSSLTDIKLTNIECNVIKKNNAKIDCPPEDIPELPVDLSISPASSYTFTFFVNYGPEYFDSLIVDSVQFSAKTEDGKEITTDGSASVCFGDCPQNCAKVVNDADDWPTGLENNANIALGVISKYQGFTAKLCPKNETVNLCYSPSQIDQGYYAWHAQGTGQPASCDIFFNEKGLKNPEDASFIITHELTHHVQEINGLEQIKYELSGAYYELLGSGFCTYPDTAGSPSESMAEAAALFVNSAPTWDICASSYSTMYPNNYVWAQDFMTK